MKTIKTNLIILILILANFTSFAQTMQDTTLANKYHALGDYHYNEWNLDSSTYYFQKVADIYLNIAEKTTDTIMYAKYIWHLLYISENFVADTKFEDAFIILNKALDVSEKKIGKISEMTANIYNALGVTHYYKKENDLALKYYLKATQIIIKIFGEKHIGVANGYFNIGLVYSEKYKYNMALKYYFKSLKIFELNEENAYTALIYSNIAAVYNEKNKFNLALDYYNKGLQIFTELLGINHFYVAEIYNDIGNIYTNKNEYDLALQYHFKSLKIFEEIFEEKHKGVATSLNYIGNVYAQKIENELALQYYFKSLKIYKEYYGEKNINVAMIYNNIGNVYINKNEFETSLKFYSKSLQIKKQLFEENHIDVALSYNNIGSLYTAMNKYNLALEYLLKSLLIKEKIIGEKHSFITMGYNNIGNLYIKQNEYNQALQCHQKALVSNLLNFNDTINISSVPEIKNYLSWDDLLETIKSKAEIFATKKLPEFENPLDIAFLHYQACDTLINQARQEITLKSDKLSLAKKASEVYQGAISLCFRMSDDNYYKEQAFYFSEKDKTRILLDKIAEKNAMQKSGIPDSLIENEKDLRSDISFCRNKLSEQLDSIEIEKYNKKLFAKSREHEALIEQLKQDYPKFAELKYNQEVPQITDIQSVLDTNTAIRSYTVADSLIYIFTITENSFEIDTISKPIDMNTNIDNIRNYLENDNKTEHEKFADISYNLYNLLFPIYADFNSNIENIIIISNDSLSLIPFETLLTYKRSDDFHNFSTYPFLLKEYTISYAPSVSMLYNKINSKYENSNNKIAIFAPVFSDNDSIIIDKSLGEIETDYTLRSIKESSFTNNDGSIKILKYTKFEANKIKRIFSPQIHAHKYMYKGASEEIVKSNIMLEYKIIHFATHGEANTEKPYLSKVVLTQDSSSVEDGMLHANEIYGLNWNADLVTLSACQTAVGKIQNGEGVMDLSRAFFYAGTNNVLASLWSVNDKSTAILMIQFYKNYNNKNMNYAKALQEAKLIMLASKEYSHPKYWAAFLLIGRN